MASRTDSRCRIFHTRSHSVDDPPKNHIPTLLTPPPLPPAEFDAGGAEDAGGAAAEADAADLALPLPAADAEVEPAEEEEAEAAAAVDAGAYDVPACKCCGM